MPVVPTSDALLLLLGLLLLAADIYERWRARASEVDRDAPVPRVPRRAPEKTHTA